jgi:uncharacterized membrane protein
MSTFVSILTLIVLDLLWILFFMNKKYQTQVLDVQGSKMVVNKITAIYAYILMIVGLVVFVLPNIRKGTELKDSLMYGFLFGIILYGVYDFTNSTIFKNWNTTLAYIDIAWGGFVFFIASYVGSMY